MGEHFVLGALKCWLLRLRGCRLFGPNDKTCIILKVMYPCTFPKPTLTDIYVLSVTIFKNLVGTAKSEMPRVGAITEKLVLHVFAATISASVLSSESWSNDPCALFSLTQVGGGAGSRLAANAQGEEGPTCQG